VRGLVFRGKPPHPRPLSPVYTLPGVPGRGETYRTVTPIRIHRCWARRMAATAIAVEIDFRPQVVMVILLNEALRASVHVDLRRKEPSLLGHPLSPVMRRRKRESQCGPCAGARAGLSIQCATLRCESGAT